MPSVGRNERQPHWVCGRNREEDRAAETGTDGYVWDVCAEERDGAVAGKYELEVQKQSVTNGSWWVSDACSGDLVEEIS